MDASRRSSDFGMVTSRLLKNQGIDVDMLYVVRIVV
jgi:hypothetical protein